VNKKYHRKQGDTPVTKFKVLSFTEVLANGMLNPDTQTMLEKRQKEGKIPALRPICADNFRTKMAIVGGYHSSDPIKSRAVFGSASLFNGKWLTFGHARECFLGLDTWFIQNSVGKMEFKDSEKRWKNVADYDLMFVDNVIPNLRSLHMADAVGVLQTDPPAFYIVKMDAEFKVHVAQVPSCVYDEDYNELKCISDTKVGDCGSLYLAVDSLGCESVIGMHVQGDKDGAGSYAVPFFRDYDYSGLIHLNFDGADL
jgi:hypothetical protein